MIFTLFIVGGEVKAQTLMSFPDEVTLPHRLWAPPAHSLSSATADSSQLVKGKEGRSEEAEPWSRRCSEAQRSSLRDEAVFPMTLPHGLGRGWVSDFWNL